MRKNADKITKAMFTNQNPLDNWYADLRRRFTKDELLLLHDQFEDLSQLTLPVLNAKLQWDFVNYVRGQQTYIIQVLVMQTSVPSRSRRL